MTNQRANGALLIPVFLKLLMLALVPAGLASWLIPGSAGSYGSAPKINYSAASSRTSKAAGPTLLRNAQQSERNTLDTYNPFVVGRLMSSIGNRSTGILGSWLPTRATDVTDSRGSITVHAAGRGNPWINLSDGRDVSTDYTGTAELQQVLEQNLARPLALASADFDEDGVPDLTSGYAGPSGGIITLHRGNVDSIYPNAPEAQQRKANGTYTDSPFLSPARVFEVPEAADFVGAGDFDADSHWDVVAAERGGNALWLLPGDGHGGFGAARRIDLPGRVTTLVTGEINRADGLTDVVVGVVAADGPKALVFDSPDGALRGSPESFELPAEATAMALGRLDGDYTIDLAVAAGADLIVVYGRDRKLSLDETRQAEVPKAEIARRSFPFLIMSAAIGDFTGDHQVGLSLLAQDGAVYLLYPGKKTDETKAGSDTVESWESELLAHGAWSQATKLACVRTSSSSLDNLVVVDSANHKLHIVEGSADPQLQTAGAQVVSLDVEGEPTAVLAMRLNVDALSDLVVLRNRQSTPSVVLTPQAILTVTNTNDSGPGSFRQAITDSNTTPGADTINFNILPAGAKTIAPLSALPAITDAVTIDATTQPGFAGTPLIELSGANAGSGNVNGLGITAGNSTVRGLVINRFANRGIHLTIGGNNVVEGNFLGTNINGTADLGNAVHGISMFDSPNNRIGGLTAGARNVISGNDAFGISIENSGSTGNQVLGNFIGTDVNGTAAIRNSGHGVHVTAGSGNTIGGTSAGARNLIAGNGADGVNVNSAAAGNLVQGNYIGTDVNGATALANGRGMLIGDAPNNTIGGIAAGARNIISGNNTDGVLISGSSATGNLLQGNYLGTDVNGAADLGNNANGVLISSGVNNAIGGSVAAARNVISGNNGRGVFISGNGATGNLVQGNLIGTEATGTAALKNNSNGVEINNAPSNVIGGTVAGARNVISGNGLEGIYIFGTTASGNQIQGNYLGTNAAGNAKLSNIDEGVFIESAPNNTVGGTAAGARNIISGNESGNVFIYGAGATGNLVQGNYIGTDASGTIALPGIRFEGVGMSNGANNNLIGGTTAAARNIISGNPGYGIDILGLTTGNLVQGNFIGTDVTGTAPLGNLLAGVGFSGGNGATIGGTTPGAGNTIAFNNGEGVLVNCCTGNAILANSIFSNNGAGIRLNIASGANNNQAAPILTAVSSSGGNVTIDGTLNSTASTTFNIQFFSNDACDPSGSGEGQIFLGSTSVQTNVGGAGNFNVTLPGFTANQVVTATATDPNNNTSAFSACRALGTANFNISGHVVDNIGNNMTGTSITLNGSATSVTDGNGNYTLVGLAAGGNYTVAPGSGNFSFSPTSQTFNNLSVDRIANFVGTQTVVSITGTVTDANNIGLTNVTVALRKNGLAAGTRLTDAAGNYSFGNLAVGANYGVTPTGSFTPSSQTFSNLTTNATANFKGAPSIPPQCAAVSFAAATNFAVGSNPFSVAAGDFNRDGKVDLAVVNEASDNLSILLGNGAGSFGAATNFATGSAPVSVAVGDFNSDGNLDLAVTNGSNNVSVLLGNGAASFAAPTNFTVGSNPVSVGIGDFNGDGKSDLAVANINTNNVSVLLGNGAGGFGAATNFAVGSQPQSVAVGDFNGDGKLDLAVANSNSNSVSVLLGNGTGGFAAATNFAVGAGPISVAVGDFNKDGRLDLAVANVNGGNVSVLLGNGAGSFAAATNFTAIARSVVVADFNGDGNLDLAVSTGGAPVGPVSVLLGNGIGSFGAATSFDVGPFPVTVAVGDFNGDGKLDLVAPNQNSANVSILLNNGSICNTQGSLTISGQVKAANNNPLADVVVTLSGPISRIVQTDVNGNYSFANLVPGGNYTVTVQTPYFVINPSRADFFNLSSSQTANFVAAPVVVPSPIPPPSDDFNSPTRDATKWTIGTQTSPPSSFDPQVTTAQVNGQLVITPVTQATGMHYNGYVSANSFDMRNGSVGVELVKAATGGADSIFAIGTDSDNFFRFLVHTAGGPTSLAPTVKGSDGIERPLNTTVDQLIFQVKINGVLTSVSIPYDPVQHKFLRFRNEPANAILFETSPNFDFSPISFQQSVVLQKGISALTVELSAGTPSPTNPGQTIFDNLNLVTSTFQFSAGNYTVGEGDGTVVITVTRAGGTGSAATVDYTTSDGTASQTKKYIPAVGTLRFAAGETLKTFQVLIEDSVGTEGNQTVNLLLGNPVGSGLNSPGRAVLTIVDNDTVQATVNALDDATFFARQHYLDFLNRQPDPDGLAFWAHEISLCGTDQSCIEVKRINVSAAFFLSIEFQDTGYLVERIYKTAYGDATGTSTFNGAHQLPVPIIRLSEFLPDTQEIGQGVVVGVGNWQQQLEDNKNAFTAEYVQRARFTAAFATTLTPAQFVDKLFQNTGVTPSASDRTTVINEFSGAADSSNLTARSKALRDVAENVTLTTNEFNRAFVLMQYFGYLRRNPNDPQDTDYTGYDFWLTKLNNFTQPGDAVLVRVQNAEMVKAFIVSGEYRGRFAP